MNPLFVVPGRLGSKRIPRKNYIPLAGITPVTRAIVCALNADSSGQVVLTSDVKPPDGFSDPNFTYL